MAKYSYKARNAKGQKVDGVMEGANEEVIATALSRNNLIPIVIMPYRESEDPLTKFKTMIGYGSPRQVDVIMFCRQMYTLSKSGVPLLRAIRVLGQNSEDRWLRAALFGVVENLEAGRSLSAAMQEYPLVFSPLICAMVNIGEDTGNLEEAFLRLSLYIERDLETKKQIKSALRYPMIVVVAITGAVAVINLMVIPAFADFFSAFDAELPWQTRLLINMSAFTVAYWPWLLSGIIGGIIGIFYYVQTEYGRLNWDRWKLKIPIVGKIMNRALLSRFARTFAMTMSSGVPVLQGLTVCSRAADNAYVGENIMAMRAAIERGESLSVTATNSGMFTTLVLQMITIGEETGDVDLLLREVADHYEREVEYDISKLGAAIEPLMIIMIAGMVLVLAMGVFLPMWELGAVALGD